MIFSRKQIIAKAWLVREVCNIVLYPAKVKAMFLVGSYAKGNQTAYSDIDFLVQTDDKRIYPNWKQIQEVHQKLDTSRIHVIFGRRETQESLNLKSGGKQPYEEIKFEGVSDVTDPHSPVF